jgi:predicted nucleic acid-binding protein
MTRFLDTNVPVYAAGAPHPLRQPCRQIIQHVSRSRGSYVTSVEVLQELLHRYRAIRRWDGAGEKVFAEFMDVMALQIEPVYAEDAQAAARLASRYRVLQTRDLFHVAVMQRLGLTEIISTDCGFDAIAEVTRIDPADWASEQ